MVPSATKHKELKRLHSSGCKSCLSQYLSDLDQLTTPLVINFTAKTEKRKIPEATGKENEAMSMQHLAVPSTQQAPTKQCGNGRSLHSSLFPPSIVMTTCSTFLALGMMPLLLYIYSRGIYEGDLKDKVPYGGIMISLVMILIPCTIGIILKSKRPQYVPYVIKVRTLGPILVSKLGREQEHHHHLNVWLE